MALSTTFTQCAQETPKFGKITQNKGHFAVQSHSRSPILVPIEIQHSKGEKSLYFATPLAFKPPPGGWVPWDDLSKIFRECQLMAIVPNSEEKLPKISTG